MTDLPADPEDLVIRRCETVADYKACQEAQRRAWGIQEDGYIVPVATMVGAQHHGGLALGAFRPNGEAVGLSFAFLGRIDGRLCLYSQLTGIVPGLQGQGLGYRLKRAQWEYAKQEGIESLVWAFDPMRSGNAAFNLGKLGAEAVKYIKNMYGPRTDALNANAPTDRLIVRWSTLAADQNRELPRWSDAEIDALPKRVERRPDGSIAIGAAGGSTADSTSLLEIPNDLSRSQTEDPELTTRWGQAVRQSFQEAFASGLRATGFVRSGKSDTRRNFYVLQPPA